MVASFAAPALNVLIAANVPGPPGRCGAWPPDCWTKVEDDITRPDRVASLEEAKAHVKSWDALEDVGKTGGVAVGTDHQRPHALRTTAFRLPLAS